MLLRNLLSVLCWCSLDSVTAWGGHFDVTLNKPNSDDEDLLHARFPRINTERERQVRNEYITAIVRQVHPTVSAEMLQDHETIMNELFATLLTESDKTMSALNFSPFVTPHINSPLLFKFHDGNLGSRNDVVDLVMHARMAVYNSGQALSKLNNHQHAAVLKLDGMSTVSGRHLINNLCSALNTRYLEVGVWRGSTLVSALAGNENNVAAVTAIDMWGWDKAETAMTEFNIVDAVRVFGDAEDALMTTLSRLQEHTTMLERVQVQRDDCFEVDVDQLLADNDGKRFNVYFYDASHTAEDQKRAFTHYHR